MNLARPGRRVALFPGGTLALIALLLAWSPSAPAQSPEENLGRELFSDVSIGNAATRIQASCASCHLAPNDLEPARVYADVLPRSVLPLQSPGGPVFAPRNTPTLLDAGDQPHFNHDGRYDSLEALIAAKLAGPEMGWDEATRTTMAEQVHALLINDMGAGPEAPYRDQVKAAYGQDVESLTPDQAVDIVVRSLAAFVRSLKSSRTSPWDAFAGINRIPAAPSSDEPIALYAGRVIGRIENQTARQLLKTPAAFSQQALDGFKVFFKTEGEGPIGNCVSCHTPPLFRDGKFHNTGIAERGYLRVHGAGSLAGLQIPRIADAVRPAPEFLAAPAADNPRLIDLGYWNYIDLSSSPQRAEGESDEGFLVRMAGSFKTPGLRNLQGSAPYMHDGSQKTLTDAVTEIITVSRDAQAGNLPNVSPEYLKMRLTENEIAPLVAFLEALQDHGREGFREMLVNITTPDFQELREY